LTATLPYLEGIVEEISVGGRAEFVEASGHWIPEEQPDRLAEIVTSLSL
jgi:hypothetical protein